MRKQKPSPIVTAEFQLRIFNGIATMPDNFDLYDIAIPFSLTKREHIIDLKAKEVAIVIWGYLTAKRLDNQEWIDCYCPRLDEAGFSTEEICHIDLSKDCEHWAGIFRNRPKTSLWAMIGTFTTDLNAGKRYQTLASSYFADMLIG